MRNKNSDDRKSYEELAIENEKLRIEKSSLEFKIEAQKEQINIHKAQVELFKRGDVTSLKKDNEELSAKVRKLTYDVENNTEVIRLNTECGKLRSEIEIISAENKHLKELINAYRAMPDVKNMIDNLSTLAVPSMNELKEFSKIITDNKIDELCTHLTNVESAIKSGGQYYGRRYGDPFA